jgi:transcriptional regulator with XRE-family HTH domain
MRSQVEVRTEFSSELAHNAFNELQTYRARIGLSIPQLADRIGVARRSLLHFYGGFYAKDEDQIAANILNYIRQNPVAAPPKPGKLYDTANARLLDELMASTRAGEWCLVFGAPGTQKSFVFETRLAESYSPAGEAGVIYVYASAGMSPSALLKDIV